MVFYEIKRPVISVGMYLSFHKPMLEIFNTA